MEFKKGNQMQKTIIIGSIVIVILAVGGVYLMTRPAATVPTQTQQSQYQSKEFDGRILEIQGSTLSVSGTFAVADHPELSDPANTRSAAVTVGANTKLQKTVMHVPNVTAPNTSYSDFKKDTASVTADDFKTDMTNNKVTVKFLSDTNIYNSSAFTASEIDYTIPEFESVTLPKQ